MEKREINNASELSREYESLGIPKISSRTARIELHRAGMKVMHMFKRPLLTSASRKKRLEFAMEHRNWTVNDWRAVVFSDESIINSKSNVGQQFKWVKPIHSLNPELIIPTVQGGPSIMVWGCVSRFGVHDIECLEGSIDGPRYISVLKDNIIPIKNDYFKSDHFIFQQDNAPVHNSQVVQKFLENHKIQVINWPPYSPDINIMENIWFYLKEELIKLNVAHSKKELWLNVGITMEQMWTSEMTKKANDLYESLPDRMEAIIKAKGGNTMY